MKKYAVWVLCGALLVGMLLLALLAPKLREQVRSCFYGTVEKTTTVFHVWNDGEREVMAHEEQNP